MIKAVIFDFFGVIEHGGEPNRLLIEYIKSELKPKYKIGIISNATGDWVSKLLADEEVSLFDDVTISYKTGAAKPNPSIYFASLNKLGIEPSEAVFIDDIEDYCSAARKLGMQAIHYQGYALLEQKLGQLLAISNN